MINQWVMVDVEANAPSPGLETGYGMTELGAVLIPTDLSTPKLAFWGVVSEMQEKFWNGGSYEMKSVEPQSKIRIIKSEGNLGHVMFSFATFLEVNASKNPMFVSDNNGFDWQFVNHAFWATTNGNPFGHSSTNLGSLYKGMKKNFSRSFKKLRTTPHTHNPVDDALGNAEAMIKILKSW